MKCQPSAGRAKRANPAAKSRVRKTSRGPACQCNWIYSDRCRAPVQVVFESGLGYCRQHADAVNSNREWLRDFAAKWLEERH